MQLKINYKEKTAKIKKKKKTHKHTKATQYATKHGRNQRGNFKIPGDKWKLRHHNPKPVTKEARVHNGEKTTSSINGVGRTG